MEETVTELRFHPVMATKVGIIQRLYIDGANHLFYAKFTDSS
jgi:hypothetical protein